MERLRAIGATAALASIACLIAAVVLFTGTDTKAAPSDLIDPAASVTAEPIPVPTIVATVIQAQAPPTPVVVSTPVPEPTADSVAVVELATSEPVAEAPAVQEPLADAPQTGSLCVGPRAIDVRIGPQDAAELIGQLDAGVCDLEKLSEIQDGWLAVRSGSGVDLIEGWVWNGELVGLE